MCSTAVVIRNGGHEGTERRQSKARLRHHMEILQHLGPISIKQYFFFDTVVIVAIKSSLISNEVYIWSGTFINFTQKTTKKLCRKQLTDFWCLSSAEQHGGSDHIVRPCDHFLFLLMLDHWNSLLLNSGVHFDSIASQAAQAHCVWFQGSKVIDRNL